MCVSCRAFYTRPPRAPVQNAPGFLCDCGAPRRAASCGGGLNREKDEKHEGRETVFALLRLRLGVCMSCRHVVLLSCRPCLPLRQEYYTSPIFPRQFPGPVLEFASVAPPAGAPSPKSTTTMNEHAYSAKLVFKVTGMPKEHGRWLYEERIVCLTARDHEAAYEKAVLI